MRVEGCWKHGAALGLAEDALPRSPGRRMHLEAGGAEITLPIAVARLGAELARFASP
jgi:hypothetical protein